MHYVVSSISLMINCLNLGKIVAPICVDFQNRGVTTDRSCNATLILFNIMPVLWSDLTLITTADKRKHPRWVLGQDTTG
jgi:hypothetical protein